MKPRAGKVDPPDGFTLIELLIVIAIIAILALIAVPNFIEAQTRAKVARVFADIQACRTALDMYASEYGRYPFNYGVDELKNWSQLTTPIAFLTTIPLDTFQVSGEHPYASGNPEGQPFEYGAHGTGFAHWWSSPYGQNDIGYVVIAIGPSRSVDWVRTPQSQTEFHRKVAQGSRAAANFLYSPTNGTISPGEIVATSKEFLNQP